MLVVKRPAARRVAAVPADRGRRGAMEYLLALAAVAVVVGVARRGYLHPGDYLVAAGLALLFAVSVMIFAPTVDAHELIVDMGAPARAIDRSAFLLRHGRAIELAAVLFALGSVAAAAIRARRPYASL
jgi:hypothetical protein